MEKVQAVGITEFLGQNAATDGLHVLLKFETLGGGEHVIAVPPDVLMDLIPTILMVQSPPDLQASTTSRTLQRAWWATRFEVARSSQDFVLRIQPESGGWIGFQFDRQFAEQLRDVLNNALA